MMKLYDMAMAISYSTLQVRLVDKKSRRICFEGNAEDLLDYSGLDYKGLGNLVSQDEINRVESIICEEIIHDRA